MTSETEEAATTAEQAVGDIVVSLLLLLTSAFVAFEAIGMPRRGEHDILTSPGLTPLLSSILIAVLSIFVLTGALRARGYTAIGRRATTMLRNYESKRVLVLIALVAAYAQLIGTVPFEAATALFLFVTFVYVRVGSWIRIIIATVLCTLLAAVGIPYMFTMPMP